MLSHALTIVTNELRRYLTLYGSEPGDQAAEVVLGNIGEGVGGAAGQVPRNVICFSVVNASEERALKNIPTARSDRDTGIATISNPAVSMNFHILVTATHADYPDALLMLSRVIRFFQRTSVFQRDPAQPENDTVDPASITARQPQNPLDRLDAFTLIFDLRSPAMEEINHLWGTLGGKQYPFVLYTMRALRLHFAGALRETPLVERIDREIGMLESGS